jgi:hypothetical protein
MKNIGSLFKSLQILTFFHLLLVVSKGVVTQGSIVLNNGSEITYSGGPAVKFFTGGLVIF